MEVLWAVEMHILSSEFFFFIKISSVPVSSSEEICSIPFGKESSSLESSWLTSRVQTCQPKSAQDELFDWKVTLLGVIVRHPGSKYSLPWISK